MTPPKPERPGAITEARLARIERELAEYLAMHQDSTDPRGCPGPALRLAEKEIPALVAEARRARSGEEQAGRELDEARAWAAKVEAAFSDAQRELSAILARAPDEKLDDAARRVVSERDLAEQALDEAVNRAEAEVARLEERAGKAEATIAAMREAVLEFEAMPPRDVLIGAELRDWKTYALHAQHLSSFFYALDQRWKSPEVKRWAEVFRGVRDRAEKAERDLDELRTKAGEFTETFRSMTAATRECEEALAIVEGIKSERDAMRAEVERLKERLVTLEAGRSEAVRLAEVRVLAAMRGWRQLPESIRSAVLAEASFLANAIEEYAGAVAQDNQATAEHIKKVLEERDG